MDDIPNCSISTIIYEAIKKQNQLFIEDLRKLNYMIDNCTNIDEEIKEIFNKDILNIIEKYQEVNMKNKIELGDKAFSCEYFDTEKYICKMINHQLENGFAIIYHCKNCKYYKEKKE